MKSLTSNPTYPYFLGGRLRRMDKAVEGLRRLERMKKIEEAGEYWKRTGKDGGRG